MSELIIYGEIGTGDCTANAIRQRLAQLSGDLTVRISSPGGDVYQGISIMNALRLHDGKVTAVIEGLAASAASFIAVGGASEVIMLTNAEMMVHDAWQVSNGNAADLTKIIADLNRISNNIASIYAKKAGGTADQWREVMQAETWYTASEAVDAGLADRVDDATPIAATATVAPSMLAQFKYAGRGNAPAPIWKGHAMKYRAELQPTETTNQPTSFTEDQWAQLTEALGLDTAATGDDVLAAVLALTATPSQEPEQAPTNAVMRPINNQSAGPVMIDRKAWDDMKRALARGLTLDQQENRLQGEQVVDQAIRLGKASATQRERWIAAYLQDPESTLHALNRAADIPRMEIGHSRWDMDRDKTESSGWVR